MKKLTIFLMFISVAMAFISCNDTETYAEKREKEDAAIAKFLSGGTAMSKYFCNNKPVTSISETDFEQRGYVTDTTKNEFVLFESSGVYMQIVRKGCGEPIKQGETAEVLCRFVEANLLTDSLQLSNQTTTSHFLYDKMTVLNNYNTFTAVFDQTYSVMNQAYQSTSVPGGWLVPLRYINIGRQSTPDEEIAKVKLIVPSAQGQSSASMQTYPCFYELTFERGL